jgi:hypothetical protein
MAPCAGGADMHLLAPSLACGGMLTKLDISSCCLQPVGVAALMAGLAACNSLNTLILTRNNFGDQGAAAIAKALPQMSLGNLDIGHNSIRPGGATLIARALAKATVLSFLSEFLEPSHHSAFECHASDAVLGKQWGVMLWIKGAYEVRAVPMCCTHSLIITLIYQAWWRCAGHS